MNLVFKIEETPNNRCNRNQHSTVFDQSGTGHSWGFTHEKVINTQRNNYKCTCAESLLSDKTFNFDWKYERSFPLSIFET